MCYAGAICYLAGKIRLLYVPWLGDGTLLKCLPDGSVCKCPSWPRSYSCTCSSGDWKRCTPRHVHKWSAVEVMLCGVICTTGSHQLPTSGCCCVQIWHLGERWLPFFFYSSRIKCWLKVLVLFFNSLLISSIFAVYTLKYLSFFFFFLSPFYCASMYSVEKTPNADAWHYPSDDHVLGEAAITEHYG